MASWCWASCSSVLCLTLPLSLQFHQILLLPCYSSALALFTSTTTVSLQTKGFILTLLTCLPSCPSWLSWIPPLDLLEQDHLLSSWPSSPGLISLNLQVSSPHCSTYLPLAILSPSCPVTSLSSVTEFPVLSLSLCSPCSNVSPPSTFPGCGCPCLVFSPLSSCFCK